MKRIPQLDGLRGIALLCVFATHAFSIPLWMGLEIFFVLSGYLITQILLKLKEGQATDYWKRFYGRRALRVLPPYVLFLIIAAICGGLPWVRTWYWYVFSAVNIGTAFHKIVPGPWAPLWSLAMEEQFYLIWPLFVYFCNQRCLRRLTLALIFVSPLLRTITASWFMDELPLNQLMPLRFDCLACGCYIAILQHEDPYWIASHRKHAVISFIAGVVISLAIAVSPVYRDPIHFVALRFKYSLSALVCGGLLVYALGTGPLHKTAYALFTWHPLQYLARVSYAFYLYHVAVLLFFYRFTHSRWLLALLAFPVSLAIAAASWHFFESPILEIRLPFLNHNKHKNIVQA